MLVRKNGKSMNNGISNKNHEKSNVGRVAHRNSQNKYNIQEKSKTDVKNIGVNLSYWNNVIDKIKQNGKMGIYVNLIGSSAKEVNDMTIEVELANKNSFAKQVLESHENKAEIEKIASIEAGKTMNVRFVNSEDKKKVNLEANSSIENMITGLDIPINIIDE